MAKIERKYLAHFVEVQEGQFERLGKDLEEFSPELSAQVDTKKNILGERSVLISGYEKTGSVDTYYADTESLLFEKLQKIIDEGLVLDQLKVNVLEVKLWEADENGSYPAAKEEAFVEINSYGGDTTGYQIPFTLHFTGNKVLGRYSPADKTFTAE